MSAPRARRPSGRIRIIGGMWRRRLLPVPEVPDLRPTPDRVRETLFNWLAPVLPGARCLDLFAGTGALGLEALSRGAACAVLVEKSPAASANLRRLLLELDAGARAEVVEADAQEFLRRGPPRPFDVIFLDPPFTAALLPRIFPLLHAEWLGPDPRLYVEMARDDLPSPLPEGWRIMRDGLTRETHYLLLARSLDAGADDRR